jgi:hypothetical protein
MCKSIKEKIEDIQKEAINQQFEVVEAFVREQEAGLTTSIRNFINVTLSDRFYDNHLINPKIKEIDFAYDVLEDAICDMNLGELVLNVVVTVSIKCKTFKMFIWLPVTEKMKMSNVDIQLMSENDDDDIGGLTPNYIPTLLKLIKELEA